MKQKAKFSILIVFIVIFSSYLIACGKPINNIADTTDKLAGANMTDMAEYATEEVSFEESDYISDYDEETNTIEDKKMVYSANIELETKNYNTDKEKLDSLLKKYNVIIDSASESDYDDYWYVDSYKKEGKSGRVYYLDIRVDVREFDNLLNALKKSDAHLTNFKVDSADLTKIYNENADKIESYEVQQDRLLELLDQAENVTEILEIEDRLSVVRYELKTLKNNNNSIDYDVKYSQLFIQLTEVERYSLDEYGYSERIKDAFEESWNGFVEFLKNFVVAFIFALPFLILGLVIIIIIKNILKKKKNNNKKV